MTLCGGTLTTPAVQRASRAERQARSCKRRRCSVVSTPCGAASPQRIPLDTESPARAEAIDATAADAVQERRRRQRLPETCRRLLPATCRVVTAIRTKQLWRRCADARVRTMASPMLPRELSCKKSRWSHFDQTKPFWARFLAPTQQLPDRSFGTGLRPEMGSF
jgi:hypothetical protein